jgi:hypothetical protein
VILTAILTNIISFIGIKHETNNNHITTSSEIILEAILLLSCMVIIVCLYTYIWIIPTHLTD